MDPSNEMKPEIILSIDGKRVETISEQPQPSSSNVQKQNNRNARFVDEDNLATIPYQNGQMYGMKVNGGGQMNGTVNDFYQDDDDSSELSPRSAGYEIPGDLLMKKNTKKPDHANIKNESSYADTNVNPVKINSEYETPDILSSNERIVSDDQQPASSKDDNETMRRKESQYAKPNMEQKKSRRSRHECRPKSNTTSSEDSVERKTKSQRGTSSDGSEPRRQRSARERSQKRRSKDGSRSRSRTREESPEKSLEAITEVHVDKEPAITEDNHNQTAVGVEKDSVMEALDSLDLESAVNDETKYPDSEEEEYRPTPEPSLMRMPPNYTLGQEQFTALNAGTMIDPSLQQSIRDIIDQNILETPSPVTTLDKSKTSPGLLYAELGPGGRQGPRDPVLEPAYAEIALDANGRPRVGNPNEPPPVSSSTSRPSKPSRYNTSSPALSFHSNTPPQGFQGVPPPMIPQEEYLDNQRTPILRSFAAETSNELNHNDYLPTNEPPNEPPLAAHLVTKQASNNISKNNQDTGKVLWDDYKSMVV